MVRILIKEGENYGPVEDGLMWHKDGQTWGIATIQQSTGDTPWWEDVEVVFEDET